MITDEQLEDLREDAQFISRDDDHPPRQRQKAEITLELIESYKNRGSAVMRAIEVERQSVIEYLMKVAEQYKRVKNYASVVEYETIALSIGLGWHTRLRCAK
jgi:hypothetical protein